MKPAPPDIKTVGTKGDLLITCCFGIWAVST